jgi:hypothetical protein
MTAAAFVAGGFAAGAVLSYAQPAPPPPGVPADGPMGNHMGGPPGGHPWMHWLHRRMAMGGPLAVGPAHGMRAFALIYRQQDRALTPPDVQKIAEAFLLWNGNHTWKVTDVAAAADGQIGFSLATAQGSVIAKFTMDPHTAQLVRVG